MATLDNKKAFVVRLCENCGGDGGWASENGELWDCCPCCDGTGEVEVEYELIDLEDLEAIDRDRPAESHDVDP